MSRSFGWLFLLIAAAILVRDGLAWHDTGFFVPATFNTLWYDLSPASLGIFRGDVTSTIPWLWNYLLDPVLSLWAAPALVVLSLALLWSARAKSHRRR